MTFIKCLLCARHLTWSLLSPFYRWGSRGSERSGKVTCWSLPSCKVGQWGFELVWLRSFPTPVREHLRGDKEQSDLGRGPEELVATLCPKTSILRFALRNVLHLLFDKARKYPLTVLFRNISGSSYFNFWYTQTNKHNFWWVQDKFAFFWTIPPAEHLVFSWTRTREISPCLTSMPSRPVLACWN